MDKTQAEIKRFKYDRVSIGIMNKQINLRIPENILVSAESYAKKHGFGTLQEFIKEAVREKLFEKPEISKKEMALVKKLVEISEKNNLYSTEEELFKKLRRKQT